MSAGERAAVLGTVAAAFTTCQAACRRVPRRGVATARTDRKHERCRSRQPVREHEIR